MTTTHTSKKATQAKTAAPEVSTETATTGSASSVQATGTEEVVTTQRQPEDRQAVTGMQRNFTGLTSVMLGGKDYAPAELISLFQASVDAADTTDASERTYHDNVTSERQAEASLAPIRKALRTFLIARYGAASTKLKEFGVIPPKKKRKPDAATLAQAVQTAKATREARGTMGKRAKAKIKGSAAAPVPAGNGTAPAAPPAGSGTGASNGAKS
jgi:hypothetical protein